MIHKKGKEINNNEMSKREGKLLIDIAEKIKKDATREDIIELCLNWIKDNKESKTLLYNRGDNEDKALEYIIERIKKNADKTELMTFFKTIFKDYYLKKDHLYIKKFSREQDKILIEIIEMVEKNASKEEILGFFTERFYKYSECTTIFVIEALPLDHNEACGKWKITCPFKAGIHQIRWDNFKRYVAKVQEPDHWIPKIILNNTDEMLISRIWDKGYPLKTGQLLNSMG